jgi:hypothetical protein
MLVGSGVFHKKSEELHKIFILHRESTILNGIVKRGRFDALASVGSSIFFKVSILIMVKSSLAMCVIKVYVLYKLHQINLYRCLSLHRSQIYKDL